MTQDNPATMPRNKLEALIAGHYAGGRIKDVVPLCFAALNRFGDDAAFLKPLAEIFYKQGDLTRALDYMRRLTVLQPEDASLWATYGAALMAADRAGEAVDVLRRAHDRAPDHPSAGINLGILLVQMQRNEEAVAVLEDVRHRVPHEGQVDIWLGHACSALGRFDDAVTAYEAVVAGGRFAGHVRFPLAMAYRNLARIPDSSSQLEAILTEQTDNAIARFALAQNQLMLGDFEAGFANYEARWQRPGVTRPAFSAPLWQGEDLQGKSILVHDEQGFGDCIQFSRFLRPLKERGARVLFRVRPKLRRLLSSLEGIDAFVDTDEKPDTDYHIPLMSLPCLLEVRVETLDGRAYLRPEPDLVRYWRERFGKETGLKVGLVWQGEPASQSEQGRSLSFEAVRPLFDLPDVSFFLLQKHHGRAELEATRLPANVTDLGPDIDNGADAFVDTAAVLAGMDVLVTSDTAPAHLGGALGTPTWLMAKKVPEWRWMLERTDSPWYGSIELFRQSGVGDWQTVVMDVKKRLAGLQTAPDVG